MRALNLSGLTDAQHQIMEVMLAGVQQLGDELKGKIDEIDRRVSGLEQMR